MTDASRTPPTEPAAPSCIRLSRGGQRTELILNRLQRTEHERGAAAPAPQNAEQPNVVTAADREHAGPAISPADHGCAPGVAHERLAEQHGVGSEDAGVHAAPRHLTLRPSGSPPHLVDDHPDGEARRLSVLRGDREDAGDVQITI